MAVKLGNGNWAVKENKLLAYNDNSGRFFNKEFDFSRGSIATYVGKDGLIKSAASDVPRIDFSDSTNGALLLEPSRTNLLSYSEDFSNAYWNKFGSSVASGFTSPDGASNAYKLVEDSANTQHGLLRSNFPINVQRTLSVFAKKGENDRVFISDYNKFGYTIGVIFNLSSGIVESNQNNSVYLNPKIESYLNGWYKCSVTWTNTTGLTVPFFGNAISGTNLYQGDGVSGIYVFGATFEEASYATSYIPSLSGSATTRLADVCNNSGSAQDFNSEEGVLYAEISALANDGTYRQILLHDNAYNNRIALRYMPTSNQINVYLNNGPVQVTFNYTLTNALDFNKIAFSFKENDFSLWVNGVEVATDTSGTTFSANTLQKIDFDFTNNYFFYGNIKDLQVFTTALTDEQLAALTTI